MCMKLMELAKVNYWTMNLVQGQNLKKKVQGLYESKLSTK